MREPQQIIDDMARQWAKLPKKPCAGCGEDIRADAISPHCASCEAKALDAEKRAQELAGRIRGVRLDPKARKAVLTGTVDETVPVKHVEAWLAGDERGLVLCGGVGSGKTVAAAVALTRVPGACVQSRDLPQRLDPWGDEAGRYSKLDPMTKGLVVLDDLGTESDSARWREAFEWFIDARVSAGRTIITTNFKKSDIRPRYGDRIADRLNHIAVAKEIASGTMRRKGDL